jgi:hypothetical protein
MVALIALAGCAGEAHARSRGGGDRLRGLTLESFLAVLACLLLPALIGAVLGARHPSWGAANGGGAGLMLGFAVIILGVIAGSILGWRV